MTLYDQAKIETADKVVIKPFFEETYKKMLGPRYDTFIQFSFTYIRKCIRVNTLKISVDSLRKRLENQGWVLKQVPWCKEGFFVQGHKTQHRFDIGNVIEHTLGYFYVQEAASMLPPVVLFDKNEMNTNTCENKQSDQHAPLRVLDICAAPGSKTTQLAQYMNNEGLLIANDIDISRLMPLTLNLQRMGVTNHLVTHNAFMKSKHNSRPRNPFGEGVEFFDKILVDAPCSGTGTIRRSFKTMSMYSKGLVKRLVKTQKELILHSFDMLKPGGEMVYSTCTQEPAENEAIVSFLLNNREQARIIPISLNIVRSDPILQWEGLDIRPEAKHCLRIYPQDNDSEGFFVAKITKILSTS